jgi:hypothetical protein
VPVLQCVDRVTEAVRSDRERDEAVPRRRLEPSPP